MATATIKGLSALPGAGGDVTVTRGTITMPRVGAWYAFLDLDTNRDLTGKVEIKAGALVLRGTISAGRSGRQGGILKVRVVAGGDGLRTAAKPKHYTGPTVGLVLRNLAADAGEAVASTADAAVLNKGLLAWTTIGIETGQMIRTLLASEAPAEAVWRLLPDGTIWVGSDTWAPSGVVNYTEIQRNPEENTAVYGMDVPRLAPGTTIAGRRIDLVHHVIGPEEYRAKVWHSD